MSRAALVDEFPDVDAASGNGVLSHESLEPFDCGGGISRSRGLGRHQVRDGLATVRDREVLARLDLPQ